jgi:hypothetical protein
MLSSNTLLLNLILLIDVTFSTPTGHYTHDSAYPFPSETTVDEHFGCYGTPSGSRELVTNISRAFNTAVTGNSYARITEILQAQLQWAMSVRAAAHALANSAS